MKERETVKQALARILTELLEEKSIENITVAELVIACGISRATFYNHFEDKYDIACWVLKERIQEKAREKGTIKGWSGLSEVNSESIYEIRSLLRHFVNCNDRDSPFRLIRDIVWTCASLSFGKKGIDKLPFEDRMLLTLNLDGGYIVLKEWIRSNTPIPPEGLVHLYEKTNSQSIAILSDKINFTAEEFANFVEKAFQRE